MMASFFLLFLSALMTIESVNGQGVRSPEQQKTAFSFFNRSRFDIVLMQETHWTIDYMETQVKREWQGDVFCTNGTNSVRSVAVLISSRLECNVEETQSDNEGRVLNVLLGLDEHMINIVNVYAPNTDTQR